MIQKRKSVSPARFSMAGVMLLFRNDDAVRGGERRQSPLWFVPLFHSQYRSVPTTWAIYLPGVLS